MDEYLDVMNRAIPADTNPAIVETVRGVSTLNPNAKRENFYHHSNHTRMSLKSTRISLTYIYKKTFRTQAHSNSITKT